MVKKPFVHQIFLLCVSAKALLAGRNYAASGKNCQNSSTAGMNYASAKMESRRHLPAIKTRIFALMLRHDPKLFGLDGMAAFVLHALPASWQTWRRRVRETNAAAGPRGMRPRQSARDSYSPEFPALSPEKLPPA
jgi:hypothetical protein